MRFLALACLLLAAAPVFACVCAGVPTSSRSFASADAVFEGVVVAKRIAIDKDEWEGWYWPVDTYEFAVVHVWKGAPARRVMMIGGMGGCDRHFAPGRRYVVYAVHQKESRYLGDLVCGTTHRVRPDRGPAIAYMGVPLATFGDAIDPPASAARVWYRYRGYAVGGATVLANVVTHRTEAVNRLGAAPVAIVTFGAVCALMSLIGVAVSYDKLMRATLLLLLAAVLLSTAFISAGWFLLASPNDPAELRWPLTYTFPESHDS